MENKRNKKTVGQFQDFNTFVSTFEVAPPAQLTRSVLSYVRAELFPPLWQTLLKLVSSYAVCGFIVLLFCPQFGITLLADRGILYWFPFLGEYGCMFACGALFLGSGAMGANICLNYEEHRRVRPTRIFQFLVFSLVALAIFLLLGAEIPIGLGLIWLAGSVGGATVGSELGWLVKYSTSY